MGLFGKNSSPKKNSGAHQWRGVIEEYRHRLPVSSKTPIVSLREGGTPLIYACNLSELLGNNVGSSTKVLAQLVPLRIAE